MKKEIYLTKEEKIEFLANVEYGNLDYSMKLNKNWTKLFASACGFAALGAGVLTFILCLGGGASLLSALVTFPISVGLGAGLTGLVSIPSIISEIQNAGCLKSISKGKITYKDYKQLVKSGDIANWKKEYEKEIEAKKLEIQGITPEVYQREIEESAINELTNRIQDEKVKLDSTRIAEEVKKRIDEHNERQN